MVEKETIKLAITEEYGYRHWVAHLTPEEWQELCVRWRTIRGLHSLVPVQLIVPQAKLAHSTEDINIHELASQKAKQCHLFEWDDSFLSDVDYQIPEDDFFSMSGKTYTDQAIADERQKEQRYLERAHAAQPDVKEWK